MHDKIFTSFPINKSASFVSSQSGCLDSFLTTDREKLKILGKRTAHFHELYLNVKKEIEIDTLSKTSFVRHKKYPIYLGLKEKIQQIRSEITHLKAKIKEDELSRGLDTTSF